MIRLFVLAILLSVAVAAVGDTPASHTHSTPAITVFVNDQTEFQAQSHSGPKITVQNLDEIHRVESRISASLPADQVSAQEIAMGRAKRHEQALVSSWTGIIHARAWRIRWLPAIVFGDGKAVWYGSDLEAALLAWRNNGPGKTKNPEPAEAGN